MGQLSVECVHGKWHARVRTAHPIDPDGGSARVAQRSLRPARGMQDHPNPLSSDPR